MEDHPCFRVFSEISYHNSRLVVLGNEAIKVLEIMRKEGMPMEVHDPLFEVAITAAGVKNKNTIKQEEQIKKRCKWYNRGFCREKGGCSYEHAKEDCQEHLNGGCTIKGCSTLRHRRKCRYFNSKEGCYRGESCEYLHIVCNEDKEDNTEEETISEKEDKKVSNTDVNVKAVESPTETEEKCICKGLCEENKVHIENDKVVCILKRAVCTEEEWDEYEDKVILEGNISELLEDLGKVLEAAKRLEEKK